MRMSRTNITLISIICMCILTVSLLICTPMTAYALSPIVGADGKYLAEFDSNMPVMALSAFENGKKQVYIEKIGTDYYMTVSINSDVVGDLVLKNSNGKVGEMVRRDGVIERHTYTLTAADLESTMTFSVFVKDPMNRTVEFTLKPLLEDANNIDKADDRGERPGLFIPEISVNAADSELETGSVYMIPTATATLCGDTLEVTTKVYYIKNGLRQEVSINDGKVVLKSIGEYKVVYCAESDKYLTSLGNNTYSERVVTLTSKVGATTSVKIEDKNGILPANYQIQSNILTSGDVFDKAKNAISKISDSYTVIDFSLYSDKGEVITPSEAVDVMLRADEYYDRSKTRVFYMDTDGNITELDASNFGRYVKVNTKNTGTYIVCQDGIAFHMPMWGYILIGVVVLAVVVTAIVVPVVLVKKKNKALKD